MTRKSKAQIAAEAAEDAAITEARDAGRVLYSNLPDAALVDVARRGAKIFPDYKECQIAFLQGYIEARANHDAFKRGE